ncbi:phosphatase PAP2 family protein [Mycobacterium sp. KBS0706]|uniref:phosphatase PAP2 family protein n=1 Tax=Mycobacterium sp. KBS0706 TaxID=2578109 RepID=UPI00110FE38D|nr:phosphatase PAP2 family protein [Mycobacterium sp. KBS0706]TSD86555.1 phosphatase PAP2 family protein [Mycobacterium sp. KBS0706]
MGRSENIAAKRAGLAGRPVLASGLVAAMLCLLLVAFADRPAALWFEAHRGSGVIAAVKLFTDIGLGIWWYALAILGWLGFRFAAFLAAYGDVRAQRLKRARGFGFMVAALVATTLTNWLLKAAIGRPRPRHLFRQDAFAPHPFGWDLFSNSFPSGHAQTMATAMTALWILFPRWGWPFGLLGGLVALSRVVVTSHYPADIVAGAWLGVVVALAVRRCLEATGGPVTVTR